MEPLLTGGIDVGSSAVKLVLMRTDGAGREELLGRRVERLRRRDPLEVATRCWHDELLPEAGVRPDEVAYVATTGEGDRIEFRTGHFYGMTAHARGALFLRPGARAVVDIGGLHARAFTIDERAKVLVQAMTSQCASGSGQFLENIARFLGVTLEEIGALSRRSEKPEKCSSICAVLAETDVINMVSRGIKVEDILHGIHDSMAGRYVRLLLTAGARGEVLVTGGLAADTGLVAAMRDDAQRQGSTLEIASHPDSVLAGAIGAALWGAHRQRVLAKRGVVLRADPA
ncbi:MAG: benzoyl-CoA reductase subunit D [Planctomycetes bacterium]|nr:benzoyl-CoA reductase subunit D [Planctomycetota bacterium]